MSEYRLTEDQVLIRDLARDLTRTHIAPLAAAIDQDVRCPVEGLAALAEAGLVGCAVPEAYGGAGLDDLAQMLVIEEVAHACASTAAVLSVAAAGIGAVLAFGSEEQRTSLLPRLVSGVLLSPAAEVSGQLHAKAQGNGFLLSGTAKFVPNAGYSDTYLLFAEVEGEAGTAFLVDRNNPGLKFGRLSPKIGLRGCVAGDVVLEGCAVDAPAILGPVGQGNAVLQLLRQTARLGMAATAAGLAQGALDEACRYVGERVQFGKRIAEFENTKNQIAECQARTDAARALLWQAAADSQSDRLSAAAKLICADTASVVTRKCVQLMGGFGYSREYPVECKMRDAKVTEVYGGTSEEQCLVLADCLGVR